jgi:hypothetical protein
VQINVGRDLHIHGGGDAFATPRAPGNSSQLWAVAGMLLYNGGRLALGLALLGVIVVVAAGAIALWALARVANMVLIVEHALGGAPTRIIAAPARMLPMLGVGDHIEFDGLNQLESDYAD